MSYTEKHLDQVDSYLSRPGRNGDGPPRLSKEGQTDPSLKEAMKDVEMVWQVTRLQKLQGKLDMLKEYEESLRQAQGPGSGAKVVRLQRRSWVLSIAAGVALLAVAGWFLFRDQGPQEIQHQYLAMHFDEYVLHDVMRGDEQSQYTPDQLRAYNLFAIQSFDKAMPLLEEQWRINRDTLSLFYLIVAHVGRGEESEGKALLDRNRSILTKQQITMLDNLF